MGDSEIVEGEYQRLPGLVLQEAPGFRDSDECRRKPSTDSCPGWARPREPRTTGGSIRWVFADFNDLRPARTADAFRILPSSQPSRPRAR